MKIRDQLQLLEDWVNKTQWTQLSPVDRGMIVSALERTAEAIRSHGVESRPAPEGNIEACKRGIIDTMNEHLSGGLSGPDIVEMADFFSRLSEKFAETLIIEITKAGMKS